MKKKRVGSSPARYGINPAEVVGMCLVEVIKNR